jgi:nicotinamide-nucleotide amidase
MQAEIITIGDEILIGQIVDSNSAFIAKELNKAGVSVYQITSVQDDKQHILNALEEANERSQLVIITGGLGPTKDDITKQTLCTYFKDRLVENKSVLDNIEMLFKKYISTPISDLNRRQALVPSKAEVLHNPYGTAPGLWLENSGTVFTSLPGVPHEMKNLITTEVIPRTVKKFDRPHIIHRTLMTYGLGESAIANMLENWEDDLPEFIKLAYLPSLGRVRLRLSAKGPDKSILENELEKQLKQACSILGDIVNGEEEEGGIEASTAKLLIEKKVTLSAAESFTGGRIAERITNISGASNYFKGAIVGYATDAKIKVLGVDAALIEKHSVVSREVAIMMAKNVKKILGTDFSIATTGNAGPTKGDSDVAVGTVYIAISTPERTFAEKYVMGNSRERVTQKSVNKAFELLQKEILNF